MTLLARVVSALDGRGVRCALIGATAMAVHGISRATLDFDLMATDERCLDRSWWAGLTGPGSSVDIRVGGADDPLAGVARFDDLHERSVDVLIGREPWQQRLLERAALFAIEDTRVRVAQVADLVLLKLYAGGPQDAWDIHQLLAAEGRVELVAGVDRELHELPEECQALWRRVLAG
jgi:predicted nucleotidyltransferase